MYEFEISAFTLTHIPFKVSYLKARLKQFLSKDSIGNVLEKNYLIENVWV